MSVLFALFWSFLQIGFTSFGGLSMVPLISSEMLGHGWMTAAEVTDIVAIAEMTPGPLGMNCATFAGMQVAGIPGALAATLGVVTPTLTLTAAAAVFFARFRSSPIMGRILTGVRPACLGMIIGIVFSLVSSTCFPEGGFSLAPLLILGVSLYLLAARKWGVPAVIVTAAVIGLLLPG